MKKLFLTALSVLVVCEAFAQVGIIGGLTSTSTTMGGAYADIMETRDVYQYHVGLAKKFDLGMGLVFQPSVVYDVRGASLKSTIDAGRAGTLNLASFDTRTGYAELLLQLQWGVTLSPDVFRVFVLGEPYVSYALNASTKSGNIIGEILEKEPTWQEVSDWTGINRMQYGFGIGGGVEVFDSIQLSARYFWDLGNLFNEDGTITDINVKSWAALARDSKCNGVKVSLTYFF